MANGPKRHGVNLILVLIAIVYSLIELI